MRQHILAGEKHALEVDRVDPVPALFRGFDTATDFQDADIVVQHVDAAIGFDAAIHCSFYLVGVGYIGFHCRTVTAFRVDDLLRFFGRGQIDVDSEDFCPFTCE